MLLIRCPWCGPRDEAEFRWGGETPFAADCPSDLPPDEQLAAELYYRRNGCGPTRERWVHWAGCGQWLEVVRDTLSHEITEVAPVLGAGLNLTRIGS